MEPLLPTGEIHVEPKLRSTRELILCPGFSHHSWSSDSRVALESLGYYGHSDAFRRGQD